MHLRKTRPLSQGCHQSKTDKRPLSTNNRKGAPPHTKQHTGCRPHEFFLKKESWSRNIRGRLKPTYDQKLRMSARETHSNGGRMVSCSTKSEPRLGFAHFWNLRSGFLCYPPFLPCRHPRGCLSFAPYLQAS